MDGRKIGSLYRTLLQAGATTRPWRLFNAHLTIIALREPDLELIKANILTKFHDKYINK